MKRCVRIVSVSLFLVSAVSVGIAVAGTPAEELSRQIPDETIGFIAASGMDSVKPAFQKSVFGKVCADPQIKAILKSIEPLVIRAFEKQTAGQPEKLEALNLFLKLGRVLVRRPVIAGFAINESDMARPVYGFVIVDAGPACSEIRQIVGQVEKLCPEIKVIKKQAGPCRMKAVEVCDDVYVYWGWAGKKFLIAVNDDEGVLPRNIYWPSKNIAAGLDEIPQAGDALVIKYDFEKLQALMASCPKKADPEKHKKIVALLEELGVTDMKTVAVRVGFDGPDMVAGEYVDIPSPRKGLFKGYGTVDISRFALAEPQAMEAGAFNMDLAELYDIFLKMVMTAVPEKEAGCIRDRIATFEANAKFKIRQGLLESIDSRSMYYVVPAGVMIEAGGGGIVAVLKLKDVKLFEENMAALGRFAADKSNGMLQVSSIPKGKYTIHSWTVAPLAMIQIMPCWSVSQGHAVLASNMILCGKAIDRLGSDDPAADSLLKTESFRAAVRDLPDEITSLVYVDTKVQFQQMQAQLQRFWPIVSMAAMNYGVTLPPVLPTFEEAAKEMKPAASYSWFDKKGAYSSYTGSGIEIGAGAAVGTAVGAAVMMPALNKAKQQAKWIVSVSNLKDIGIASMVYESDNQGKMPPNLEVLVNQAGLRAGALQSKLRPDNFEGPSYIYVPGQAAGSDAANVLAYENPAYLCDTTVVLFIDGHVEKMKRKHFIMELKATYQRLGKEMPEVRFKKDIEREKRQKSKKKSETDFTRPVKQKPAPEKSEKVRPPESAESKVVLG